MIFSRPAAGSESIQKGLGLAGLGRAGKQRKPILAQGRICFRTSPNSNHSPPPRIRTPTFIWKKNAVTSSRWKESKCSHWFVFVEFRVLHSDPLTWEEVENQLYFVKEHGHPGGHASHVTMSGNVPRHRTPTRRPVSNPLIMQAPATSWRQKSVGMTL